MTLVCKTVACLRFVGDDLDPDEISSALGKEPTYARRKGDVWLSPKGLRRTAKSGIWILNADDAEPGDLDQQVAALFSGLGDDFSIWRNFAKRYRGDIYAGVFMSQSNEGLNMSPLTLNSIGIRGLEFGLDIYSNIDDEPKNVSQIAEEKSPD